MIAKLVDGGLTLFSKSRMEALLKEIDAIIKNGFEQINANIDAASEQLIPIASNHISALIGTTKLTESTLKAISSNMLIQGAPSKDWWAKQSQDLAFKFVAEIRQGAAQSLTVDQTVRRVKPLFDKAETGVRALVNTSLQTASNMARLETFKQNQDVVKQVKQLSTLDGHTSDICMAYSGAVWKLPDFKPVNGAPPFNSGPPRHFNCRSVLIPITSLSGAPGERTSEIGMLDRNITFDDFLSRKTKAQQDEMLGVGRAELWRDGHITLRDLLDQTGRPLTLAQLQSKYQH